MSKLIFSLIFFFWISNASLARNTGETEIITEDGIEVFQEEKYYLLKKNVKINSDDFDLTGQLVKIYFDNGLDDLQEIIANDNVVFNSPKYNIKGKGNKVIFNVKNQNVLISGKASKLHMENLEMVSNSEIKLDNTNGSFLIVGENSKLITENVKINGSKIQGDFEIVDGKRVISILKVEDKEKLIINTDEIEMFAKKALFDNKKSIIELFENVKIVKENESIAGDYGILDTKKNSYKVSSQNSKKVRALIGSNE
tara:strand:- start:12860 stop:13624 length:765 start_codon:yes stop_codon:yes gene_type:complete